MRYAVIMAGGAGKRLWPASRQNKPKQLIKMIDGKSLLEIAIGRLEGLFEPEQILIVTNAAYADQVREILPDLPKGNVIGEPEGRDTANAVALATEIVSARDEQATMAIFTADHIIRPEAEFRRCVRHACEAAEGDRDALLTLGVKPTWPHTGLGYIHCGGKVKDGVLKVQGFKEKPDHRAARQYVETGEYYWNSGMFVWTVPAIRKALTQFLPEAMRQFAGVGEALKAGEDIAPLLKEIYQRLTKISIDYAVMEKAPNVLMVELTAQWLDVGSWPALSDVLELDEDGNAIAASRTALLDSNRNVIYSDEDHLLALIGMDDCIIVHTNDATLICNKSDSQRLKELVDTISRQYGQQYI